MRLEHIFGFIANVGFTDITLQEIDNYIKDIQNGTEDFPRFNLSEHAGLCTAGAPLIGASVIACYATASLTAGGNAEGGEGGFANWQINECQEKLIEQWAKAANLWENEGTSTFMGNSSFMYTIRHSDEVIDGDFCIIKEDSMRLSLYLNLRRRRRIVYDEKELQLCSQNIEEIQYDDLIKVDDSNSELYTKEPFNTVYFIWSKSKGLLQYKYLNGDVYTFYKKLP